MKENSQQLAEKSLGWLKNVVFPLWSTQGFNSQEKLFVENLSLDKKPLISSSRALVQARQIYSFAEGVRLNLIDKKSAQNIVHQSAMSILEKFSLPNGAIVNSIDKNGHLNKDVDLYTQAFALFGYAVAYKLCGDKAFKTAAFKNISYLYDERKNSAGGFTEIKDGKVLFQSNPHMHLFESAMAWMKIDSDSVWKKLTSELSDLCLKKFIDSKTGFLAEHFDQNWNPLKENSGFIAEPGHHYEWSWLFVQYKKMNRDFQNDISQRLFSIAEKYGLSASGDLAFDEIWSNGEPKKISSRFWPQCERVKAAVVLGQFPSADRALNSLVVNFFDMENGLWKDTRLEDGTFKDQQVKASSLYHIINAISEYAQFRHGSVDV